MSDDLTIWGTLSVGGLIRLLEKREREQMVSFDFGHRRPSGIHSYRGFYDHLAIGHVYGGDDVTVDGLLLSLKDAIGKTFQGWKGGDYRMNAQTPIWCDDAGDASSTAIVGIGSCDYWTILETRHVNV